jgi:GPH family glycoside/pentoside/hexuronide:cation symporter
MEESLGFFESIKITGKNKPFFIVEISIFANVIMQGLLLGYIVFLFDYAITLSTALDIFSITAVINVLAAATVWMMRNIEKYGLKKLMRLGALIAISGFVAIMIIGNSANVSQHNKLPFSVIAIPFSCIAFGLVAYLLLGQPLMADCIDNDELLTGKRRETTYSGINALITKPAVSIGNFMFLWIIASFGYNENIADPLLQPTSVATGVVLAFTVLPVICLAIGFIVLHFYPLDGPEWDEKKRKLQEIHKKKEVEYIKHLEKQGVIEKKKNKSIDT